MKSNRLTATLSVVALATGLAACSTTTYPVATVPAPVVTTTTVVQAQQAVTVEWGRVTNVSLINPGTMASGAPGAQTNSAAGTVIGGVVGAALGNTIGGGTGRAAATILGAVGGAIVGNKIAQANQQGIYSGVSGPVYRVTVQTDQGATRVYDVSPNSDLRVGDRVRVENGVLYLG